ncbi:DUF6543 domain-containing protein [Pseudomonas sp. BP8]|uniref:dermonecrotic toxin domain-containing protein n=1 Tax=Pseudomonas sp. BP8 TaxID=2817864 RepID=UPI001AE56BEF|nr:DUF6543 domain-containing protein [Pseudomonas sp. BP8]MBP2260015.1 hypothetical protein [Pseudomonas sp. BP8]HDS1734194.1 hypothetical protein [Pseudomonas putida]
MPSQANPAPDFHRAVANEFASRPTLRGVLGQQVLALLIPQHSSLAAARLADAEPLILQIPSSTRLSGPKPYDVWTPRPLLEVMLESLHSGQPLAALGLTDGDFLLSVEPPWFLRDAAGESLPSGVISINAQLDALNELLFTLVADFCQSQIDYWKAAGSQGVSRDLGLQHLLKSALLTNLPLQGLDDQQRECVHGLLSGNHSAPSVFVVQAEIGTGIQELTDWLPNLLVRGEWDEREVLLWCAPSSVIKAFASFDEFALALQEELAEHYRFDALTWNRYQLEGDVFAQQTSLMLEILLDSISRLRYAQLPDVAALEQSFSALSDPSRWFIRGYGLDSEGRIALPPGLRGTNPVNSFAYQRGVFELALAQAQSEGTAALEDVLDLQAYTRQALRAQMLADYPDEANYFADDLILALTVTAGRPGGASVGPGDGVVDHRSLSLTEFAIGNLSSLQGAQLKAVSHRESQLIMPWMNVDYLKTLVQRVDVGRHYPDYVAEKLDDPATQPERVKRFAREWRCSLLFSALFARLQGGLSDAGLQCVTDYCRGYIDSELPGIILMPLAFRREASAQGQDEVRGMYVLFASEPARVLLYRPLYPKAPVLEFASLELMLAAIRRPGPLQDSVLGWLTPAARAVYDHGGFYEPHLPGPILDTQLLPERVRPPTFGAQFWLHDADLRMYQANRDLLVELADRQSVSNAESRWAILLQGAWLLFDVTTLLLRGPVATVAWLVQAITGLQNDLAALRDGDAFERCGAVVELLLNTSMALMHLRLPQRPVTAAPRLAELPGAGRVPLAWLEDARTPAVPKQGKVGVAGGLALHGSTELDFSWRGAQGFNVLTAQQRKALFAMRSQQSLQGLEAVQSGVARGLYEVGGRHFLYLADGVYEARVYEQGPRIIGADGTVGPWLVFEYGQWRIDRSLRLLGGMPKSRREVVKEQNRQKIEQLKIEEVAFSHQHNALAETLNKHRDLLNEKDKRIEVLESIGDKDELTAGELDVTRRLRKQIKLKIIYEIKDLIENALKHEQVVTSLSGMRHEDYAFTTLLKQQRSMLRQGLIENLSVFYNEMATMINQENLDTLADQIVIHPERPEEIRQYQHFRTRLDEVVRWETDLVDMSRLLDCLLEETLKDDSFVFFDDVTNVRINKDAELKATIATRRISAVDLDFRLLQDLAEASLDRLADVDERLLSQYLDYLAGDSLKSAGNAHGDLAGSELSLAEQIDVLSGILEGYEEAAAMADYLGSVGGVAIRQEHLQLYKKTLMGLQRTAQGDLAQAVREQEFAEPRPPRPVVYAPRGGRRRLVQTQRGRKVLAEEVEQDGVAVVQQRDQRTQHVLKTFHQDGGEWVEDAPPAEEGGPLFSPLEPRLARKRAQALLAEVERVNKLARSFFRAEQPNGLNTVVNDHLEKLHKAQATLPRMSPEDALYESLGQAIEGMQAMRRDLLTGIYLSTDHPTADSLRFLFDNQQVSIRRTATRKPLSAADFLDVYEVRRMPRADQAQGDGLWEAHFHYPDTTTGARQFSKGHLKLWAQRKLGRTAQLRAAVTGEDLLAIYRGDLRLAQVEGVIPFD